MRKIILGIAILLQLNVFAQTNTDLRPQVKSPEVNKFEQYMNMPVNLVSGTPQVSIPIYTLEYGGMSLPISLEYDASGVKVESIASCVGQNWTLNVGGVVSRIVKGAPDEGDVFTNSLNPTIISIDGYYKNFGLTTLESQLNAISTMPLDVNANSMTIRNAQFNQFIANASKGEQDTQPDLFYFSTPEGGSKFVFNDQRQVVYLENTDFIIKEDYVPNFFKSFIATSSNGIKYKFGLDTGLWNGQNNAVERAGIRASGENITSSQILNSWFMTSIENPTNKKKININYLSNIYESLINTRPSSIGCLGVCMPRMNHNNCEWTEEFTYNNFAASPTSNCINTGNYLGNASTVKNRTESKLIENIITDDILIKFLYEERDDVIVDFANSGDKPKRLKEISINQVFPNNTLQCIKRFVLKYQNRISNEATIRNDITAEVRKRFFLTEMFEIDCENKIQKPYKFVYNETSLPNRLSYAQDQQGYYNGKLNNPSLFEAYNVYYDTALYADKSINFELSKAGSLEKIIYPTKGSVTFEYEPHIVEQVNHKSVNPIPVSTIKSDFQPETQGLFSSPSNTFQFIYNLETNQCLGLNSILTFPNPIRSDLFDYCYNNPSAQLGTTAIQILQGTDVIKTYSYDEMPEYQYATSNNLHTFEKNVYLDPNLFVVGNSYTIKVYGTECNHNTTKLTVHNVISDFRFEGLRIKNIKHSNYDNSIIKQSNYEYFDPKRIEIPAKVFKMNYNLDNQYYNLQGFVSQSNINLFNQFYIYESAKLRNYYFFSYGHYYYVNSGLDPYNLYFSGPSICYGKVIESDGNGKTEHNFYKYKSYLELQSIDINAFNPPFRPFFQSTLGGTEINVIHKNNNNTNIKTNRNEFNYTINNTGVRGLATTKFDGWSIILFNPYTLYGQTKTLKSETESTNLNNNMVEVKKEYEYNGNGHNQPTKITTTDNQGNQSLITNLTYPLDIPSPDPSIRRLILENRKETPIKTENYRGTEKISEQTTEYEIYPSDAAGTYLTLPKFVYSKKGNEPSNPLEKKVTYNYDTHGNLIEYTPENGVTTSIIWGYNNTQPIAKLENCVYATIAISTINNLKNLSNNNNEANLLNELNNLRTALPNAMVSSYTYKPLIGISTMTDAKGDKMTYEYDEFNRLKWVKDKEGNILSENQYHYKK